MEIQLTAKHLKITPSLRDYVQQKIGKAQKYFDHIVWGQVILSVEKRAHKAEAVVHAPGQTFRALASAEDLYAAIDLASDKIDAQLKKYKERLKIRRSPKASEAVPVPLSPPAPMLSVLRQPVEVLTPQAAVEELESAGRRFLAYVDKETDQIHVVFRREDETFGIVHPIRKTTR